MDGKLFAETTDAVRQVTERFGVNILTDHKRFCSAFSDFAPRLSKENKAFFVALSEDIGEIFINENHAVTNGSKNAEEVIQRAMAEICEYLNEEKAELIARSIAAALGWQAGEVLTDASDYQSSSFVASIWANASSTAAESVRTTPRLYTGTYSPRTAATAAHRKSWRTATIWDRAPTETLQRLLSATSRLPSRATTTHRKPLSAAIP